MTKYSLYTRAILSILIVKFKFFLDKVSYSEVK